MEIRTNLRSQCHPERVKKTQVVLHNTAGSTASGAVAHWNATNAKQAWRLGTAYVVDRDAAATVYQVFDPECWAYALGIGNAAVEQRAIQIEVVNWGPLRLDQQGRYYPKDYPDRGLVVPTNQVHRAVYRGEAFFQAYTTQQITTLATLVRQICATHGIPLQIPPLEKRGVFDPKWAASFAGIVDHTNYRQDGKWDVGPQFPWVIFQELLNQAPAA